MKKISLIIIIAVLLPALCGCSAKSKFPTSEEVKAVVPQKIDTGEDFMVFDAYDEDVDIRGAETADFSYHAYYNKRGELKKVEFFSYYETCCHNYDEYEATYDKNYKLIKYHYENGRSPFVRLRRRMHHYF